MEDEKWSSNLAPYLEKKDRNPGQCCTRYWLGVMGKFLMRLSYLQCSGTRNGCASRYALMSLGSKLTLVYSAVWGWVVTQGQDFCCENWLCLSFSDRECQRRPESWRGSKSSSLRVYSRLLILPRGFLSFTEAEMLHPEVSSLFQSAVSPVTPESTYLSLRWQHVQRCQPHGAPSSQLLSFKNSNFPLGSIFVFPGLQNLVNSH